MEAFDPADWNFIKLKDFEIPGGANVYEYKNHPVVDGIPDFLRLNLYISKDHDFVNIWWGLLEPIFTESRLESVYKPEDFDYRASYNENLFRGYIETQEAAGHILKALRVDSTFMYKAPQVLSGGTDNKLRCDRLEILEAA
ncbi:MAG: hypothetical protein RIQ56_778 [Candidatus Parcubacteria bacterium]|jgi:hypothetical protein